MLRLEAVTYDGTWPPLQAGDQVQNMPLPHICHRVSRMTCQAHYTWSFSCHTREHMGHLLQLLPTRFYSDTRKHILPRLTSPPKRSKIILKKENSDLNVIHVKAWNNVRVGNNFFTFKKHVSITRITLQSPLYNPFMLFLGRVKKNSSPSPTQYEGKEAKWSL